LVFIGILLLRKALLRFFDEKVSDITVLTIFTSTNLLFYGAFDVINSHSISFFLACCFLYFYTSKKIYASSVLMGLIIGGLALVRSQDYLFLIFPILDVIKDRKNLAYSMVSTIVAVLIFSPQ